MTSPEKISVIIPAYNEDRIIRSSIAQTIDFLQVWGKPWELIVVDDGSTDRTWEELSEAKKQWPQIVIVQNQYHQGKGWALKTGFCRSTGSLVAFLDADLDLPPQQLKDFYRRLKKTGPDVIIGCKRHPQSRVNYPSSRKIVSFVYFTLVKILFRLPIRDTQTGLKLFRREVLERIFPRTLVKQYAYDLELLVLAHYFGYRIAEAPVVLNFRRRWGRIRWYDIFYTWWDTMAIFYRLYIRGYYKK